MWGEDVEPAPAAPAPALAPAHGPKAAARQAQACAATGALHALWLLTRGGCSSAPPSAAEDAAAGEAVAEGRGGAPVTASGSESDHGGVRLEDRAGSGSGELCRRPVATASEVQVRVFVC